MVSWGTRRTHKRHLSLRSGEILFDWIRSIDRPIMRFRFWAVSNFILKGDLRRSDRSIEVVFLARKGEEWLKWETCTLETGISYSYHLFLTCKTNDWIVDFSFVKIRIHSNRESTHHGLFHAQVLTVGNMLFWFLHRVTHYTPEKAVALVWDRPGTNTFPKGIYFHLSLRRRRRAVIDYI